MEWLRASTDVLVPLSFLMAGISIVFAAMSVRSLLVTIPFFVAVVFFEYPHSHFFIVVQMVLLAVWGLLLIGYGRGAAYSIPSLPKFAVMVLLLIGLLMAGTVFVLLYIHHRYDDWKELILLPLAGGATACCLAYFIVCYVVCPLVVLKKKQVHTTITNYYILYDRIGHGQRYVCFGDCPYTHYRTSAFAFQKFRNKIGVPVSYMKYKCPLHITYIRKIVVEDKAGKSSQWETSTKSQRKISLFVLVFLAVSVFFFFIVFGTLGLLPWQS